jgi:hypothetical protein
MLLSIYIKSNSFFLLEIINETNQWLSDFNI